jgi:hypothetical protein
MGTTRAELDVTVPGFDTTGGAAPLGRDSFERAIPTVLGLI